MRVHDVFEENDTAYYVMDYIEGESLGEIVRQRGAIPEAEAIKYVRDVADALEYIHSRNFNHLDIKPNNLIKRKSDGKVLVIDFGVSKQYDAITSESTTTTSVCISAGYSPAEQYSQKGMQSFSPQSDVYSLAATLYKLLTGVTPPEGTEVLNAGLPVDELVAHHVSEPVRLAIAMAMKKKQERTQSVAEFIESLSPSASKRKKRWWLVAGAAVAVGALLVVACVFLNRKDGTAQKKNYVDYSTPTDSASTAATEVKSGTHATSSFMVNGVKIEMVPVECGTFTMGATAEQGSDAWVNEKPAHSVDLDKFYIGKTEVTQKLWVAVMGSNPSHFKGDDLPVENVNWYDCQMFIEKLNALTGQNFRFPSEAEREYACRGGIRSNLFKYSGADDIEQVAWYKGNCGNKTHAVGSAMPNELGIYDMSGNVWEWCSDFSSNYSGVHQSNPDGPGEGIERMSRGGSWGNPPRFCRSSARLALSPSYSSSYLGLRLAMSL